MDLDSMLLTLPAEKAREDEALEKLNPLFARYGGDTARLPKLTQTGMLQSAQIAQEGRAVAVLWYRVESATLTIDTMVALSKGRTAKQSWEVIWRGVEMLAKSFGCQFIEGVTQRSALAKIYLAQGFCARGVLFRKELANV